MGKGKLDEIKQYVDENEIGLVIFDDDLTTKQVANLERELQVKILDRTSLILDIFAKRAQTANAKTQVELAHNTSICCPDSPECGLTSNASAEVSA